MIQILIQKSFSLTSHIGVDQGDTDAKRLQKSLLVVASIMFDTAGAVWGILYFLLGEPIAGLIPLGYAVFSLLSLITFHLAKRYSRFLFSQLLLILLLPFLLMIALGGFVNSSGVIIWSIFSPIGALLFEAPQRALRWLTGYLVLLALSGFLESYPLVTGSLSSTTITFFFILNIGAVSAITITLLRYFINQKDHLFNLLQVEQAKSENLLLNILPRDIANRLKAGEHTIADNYDRVSILFVDLVDFTPLSAICDSKSMVVKLSEIFLYFDKLVDVYNAEKVETVGDSYVIAVGLPTPREDHAKIITQLALEIRTYFVKGVFLEGHRLDVRIGINSGPIMAGVIERKKISYSLWGDTINTASRMQSHGLPGQIQVSKKTYQLIKDEFICEPRGRIHVKGKGEMEVWLVVSARNHQ